MREPHNCKEHRFHRHISGCRNYPFRSTVTGGFRRVFFGYFRRADRGTTKSPHPLPSPALATGSFQFLPVPPGSCPSNIPGVAENSFLIPLKSSWILHLLRCCYRACYQPGTGHKALPAVEVHNSIERRPLILPMAHPPGISTRETGTGRCRHPAGHADQA